MFLPYFTTFVPILEYGSCIWSMACDSNIKRTNKVVNFFIRIVKHRCPALAKFSKHEILSTLQIHDPSLSPQVSDPTFLFRIMNGQLFTNELLPHLHIRIPRTNSNCNNFFYTKASRLSLEQRSFLYRLQTRHNTLNDPPGFHLEAGFQKCVHQAAEEKLIFVIP